MDLPDPAHPTPTEAVAGPEAPPTGRPTRRYRSTRRQEQAARTRADVLDAAVALFRTSGWKKTTIADIAERAGVAVETVYSGFRSKKGLLRAAMDVAVVGDAEEIPFADRPEATAMGRGTLSERLAAAAEVTASVHERSVGVWRAILEAAAGDAEVEKWRAELEAGRRTEVARSLDLIYERRVEPAEVDVAWVLLGPESYLKLTGDAGWDRATYEREVAATVGRIIVAEPGDGS